MGFIGALGGITVVASIIVMKARPQAPLWLWLGAAAMMAWAEFGFRLVLPF